MERHQHIQKTEINFSHLSQKTQHCIEHCLECHKTCSELISYCLKKGGMHAEPKHIQTLLACADICSTSAHFMMWESDLQGRVCGICADACFECAQDCERMSDDEMMKVCAQVCRGCAETCLDSSTRH